MSANHQLTLYLAIGPPIIPPNPAFPQNALAFCLKANGVLDAVQSNGPPLTPQWNAALNAIIGHANTTLDLLFLCDGCIPGNPVFPLITTQADHTIAVATSLMGSF